MPTEITAEENHAAQINAEIRTIDLTSNSSSKYNGLIPLICSLTGLPNAEIHITAASMASNVEGRLRNGKHQNKHYQLCVLIVSNSQLGNAVEQAKGHIDNARSGYFNTIVFMQPNGNNGDWIVSSIVTNSDGRTIAMRIKNEYNLANVLEIGNATAQQSMQQSFFGTIGAGKVYLDLEEMFRAWLPSHGVNDETAKGYVSHLKAVSEPCAPHPPKGAWLGFFEDLTGCSPEKKVYEISSLNEFDRVYKKLGDFFNQDEPSAEGFNQGMYSACYNYAKTSSDGDQGKTRNGFVKYREFLSDPFIKKIISLQIYLSAIRTKPFILLAGISGTGKSRLVRQLARGCCPSGHELGKDNAGNADKAKKPGNFEMIPVRPNWHDSTELLGYVTRLTDGNKPKYVIKPFVKFLVKAAIYKDVPFFLCLDEMNLAPVEQYFAEYLSVVETRTKESGEIVSDVLVNFDLPEIDVKETVKELMRDWIDVAVADGAETVTEKVPGAKAVYDKIIEDKGIRIPKNFIVMGTVNMDETTCSFSRKVLDRAMTFELNEVDMEEGLAADNTVTYGSICASSAFATDVEGFDFYAANKDKCDAVKAYLVAVNKLLDGTPFKFAYRSRNEIMLYCIERTKSGIVELPQALDEATSMKILSRIEGDEQKLQVPKRDGAGNIIKGAEGRAEMMSLLDKDALPKVIADALKAANNGVDPNPPCTVCSEKLAFMAGRLESGFTNFFV